MTEVEIHCPTTWGSHLDEVMCSGLLVIEPGDDNVRCSVCHEWINLRSSDVIEQFWEDEVPSWLR